MTKLIILFSTIFLLSSITSHNIKVSEKDKKNVQNSVLSWADSVFYHHEEYRFEQFHAEYTDLYQISVLRLDMYKNKQINLEKLKQKGFYKKTDAEYEKEHGALVLKNIELEKIATNFEDKADSYQILFWSNIKTNQGPTVYYSHLIKLDNDFHVTSAEIKSEIGKKNEKTKILYAKDTKKRR